VRAGIDFTFERLPGARPVSTNQMLAVEMIGNLIDNAIKHNREGGQVWVGLENTDAGVRVIVQDDGPGIPPDKRATVFGRFARLHRNPALGSGLGLSIVDSLARAIGAEVELDAGPSGSGLRATVTFAAVIVSAESVRR